ncbi:glycosyltransferase involved in cell wall biosynthesis [Salinibacter ruber]|uniref:glycosyltransferase family 4 protein n=1 Tax=Salinibacter ruber TaxID=146919 RepID=UPI002167F946|nr:glycosyltransferase family 4 protein [Salinibacter ruber]MCS4181991.1 glycosyltransferase involved in cell wall biosynthesis [Salinibacter ruber]
MKVIIGCDSQNPYESQLSRSLSSHRKIDEVEDSLYKFWVQPDEADILHIQWPEALYSWKKLQPWKMARLANVLDEWASTASIVTTVHNHKPHNLDNWKRLYRLVYQNSDGIIHLGEASRRWFLDRYDFASEKEHAVIPHGNYTCFPDRVTSSEARERLDINSEDWVCLSFGEIRHSEERDLLVEAFDHLGARSKKLLIAGRLPPLSRRRLRYWRLKYDPRINIHEGWIPDEEVQLYLRAADVLVIPREGVLNSGNVALGFTFGRPVVGPDEGVIGEVLSKTGNPTHEPGNPKALAEAVEEVKGSQEKLGTRNKNYATEKMNWDTVASQHVDLYRDILN